MNTFALRLKATRKERKLSQAKLAERCGLSQSAIANYEGQSRSTPKDVFPIAQALGVTAEWLLKGTLPKEPVSYVSIDQNRLRTVEPNPVDGIYAWPFTGVTPAQVWSLSPENRRVIEDTLHAMLQRTVTHKV